MCIISNLILKCPKKATVETISRSNNNTLAEPNFKLSSLGTNKKDDFDFVDVLIQSSFQWNSLPSPLTPPFLKQCQEIATTNTSRWRRVFLASQSASLGTNLTKPAKDVVKNKTLCYGSGSSRARPSAARLATSVWVLAHRSSFSWLPETVQ